MPVSSAGAGDTGQVLNDQREVVGSAAGRLTANRTTLPAVLIELIAHPVSRQAPASVARAQEEVGSGDPHSLVIPRTERLIGSWINKPQPPIAIRLSIHLPPERQTATIR